MDETFNSYNSLQTSLQAIPAISQSVQDALKLFLVVMTVGTVLFLVLYLVSSIRRWKVQKAVFDIQKNVREMNERDKNRSMPVIPRVGELVDTQNQI